MSRIRKTSRAATVALLISVAWLSGCAYTQMPRIDPTGRRIFAEPPISTTPIYRSQPGVQPAGTEWSVVLQPGEIVAPVGSEVILVGGVLGNDGFLRTNQRLEWSLADGGVGHFVAVGKGGMTDLLVGDFTRPHKIDNTFAVGSTSRAYVRLDRGTPDASDDVCVARGQGWISLTSPIEGSSYVTLHAPGVPTWDLHSRKALVHWVDAQWRFPPPAINPAGTRHTFTTVVTRQSNQAPCVGWSVRYEIVDGPPAGFAPNGAEIITVPTDDAGQACVEIFQKEPGPGTNKIAITVVRPAAAGGPNGRELVVGQGSTIKTWTAAALAVRKLGPATAALGATLTYQIEVSNPGDQPANNVTIVDALPRELNYIDSTPPAQLENNKLKWQIGQLAGGQTQTFQLNCRAEALGSITNCVDATGTGGPTPNGQLTASDCATTTVTAPQVDVQITGPTQATVGTNVTFQINVTNRGQVPTDKLLIKDRFELGLKHARLPSPIERDLGSLAAGQMRQIAVTFQVTRAGRLCHTVEVTSPGGVRATAEACLTAVEPVQPQTQPPTQTQPPAQTQPPLPAPVQPQPPAQAQPQPSAPTGTQPGLALRTSGPRSANVDDLVRFTIDVTNTGAEPLTNVRVEDQLDATLFPWRATEGHTPQGNGLVWTLDSIPPGRTDRLEVHCKCVRAATQACHRVTVTLPDGSRQQSEACLEILPAQGELTMTVTDLRDPVRSGKGVTYELRVTNPTDAVQRNVALEVKVPKGLQPDRLGTSGPGTPQTEGQTIYFTPVAELEPGEVLRYHVRVTTRQPGQYTVRAEVTSESQTTPLVVEETTEVYE